MERYDKILEDFAVMERKKAYFQWLLTNRKPLNIIIFVINLIVIVFEIILFKASSSNKVLVSGIVFLLISSIVIYFINKKYNRSFNFLVILLENINSEIKKEEHDGKKLTLLVQYQTEIEESFPECFKMIKEEGDFPFSFFIAFFEENFNHSNVYDLVIFIFSNVLFYNVKPKY